MSQGSRHVGRLTAPIAIACFGPKLTALSPPCPVPLCRTGINAIMASLGDGYSFAVLLVCNVQPLRRGVRDRPGFRCMCPAVEHQTTTLHMNWMPQRLLTMPPATASACSSTCPCCSRPWAPAGEHGPMGSGSRSMLSSRAASDAASLPGGRCRPRGAAAARLPIQPAPPSPHRPSCRKTALINTVVIGAVNVGCTIIAVLAVDRFGRRFLLVEGGIQCCIMMIIVGEWCCE